jgi:hypothetical protein
VTYRQVGGIPFRWSDAPGACLWCGDPVLVYGKRWLMGRFCTLKCAASFGVFHANAGYRIERENETHKEAM